MRNWNNQALWGAEARARGLDRTYEELKPQIFPPSYLFAHSFGSYLWGIETRQRRNPNNCRIRVWIVPMRNWNSKTQLREGGLAYEFGSYLWGIETSYHSLCNFRQYGLDRTYEELKLLLEDPDQGSNIRLDRTYEELKHKKFAEMPMTFSRFGSYLWGIETNKVINTMQEKEQGLDRTYEELKLVFLGLTLIRLKSRLDRTYEELKQPKSGRSDRECSAFGSYLSRKLK